MLSEFSSKRQEGSNQCRVERPTGFELPHITTLVLFVKRRTTLSRLHWLQATPQSVRASHSHRRAVLNDDNDENLNNNDDNENNDNQDTGLVDADFKPTPDAEEVEDEESLGSYAVSLGRSQSVQVVHHVSDLPMGCWVSGVENNSRDYGST